MAGKQISCGVLITNEKNEILMGKSTGNKFFDIPKGKIEPEETPMACVMRETMEETSFSLDEKRLKYLGLFSYNPQKNLHIFHYRVEKKEVDMNLLKCTSFFEDFYTKKLKPEMEYFEWHSIDDNLALHCAKSMAKLLNQFRKTQIIGTEVLNISKPKF